MLKKDQIMNGTTLNFHEHEPVFTLGKNANENHILQNYLKILKLFM